MSNKAIPQIFLQLQAEGCIAAADIITAQDGFCMVYKSLSDILAVKGILDFPDSDGTKLACGNFFDDWFLYAVPSGKDYTYSLLKLREQEHDMEGSTPADGDTPGVTISFIAFHYQQLLDCLSKPSDENREQLSQEINRVVAFRRQKHHPALKQYFLDPASEGSYLVATLYTKHIASFAVNGRLPVPDRYRENVSRKVSSKYKRILRFIELLNQKAEVTVCDKQNIYIKDRENPDAYEAAAILATHTGNTSLFSFAAEVEYHAKFLCPLAKIRIPFFGRSLYDSAIRADMTIDDTELEGPAPFYRDDSRIVKRQYHHHKDKYKSI